MIWLLCVILALAVLGTAVFLLAAAMLALACTCAGLAEKAMRERHMYDYGDYLP